MPTGRPRLDLGHRLLERLAQGLHVAARRHDDAQPDHRLALEAHRDLLRVLVAALDLGHVGQGERAAVGAEGQRGQLLGRDRRAVDADGDALALGLDRAGRHDGVLPAHDLEDLVDRHAQHGEPRVAELDVDLLVLQAEQVGLGDVGHAQQALARGLDDLLDLGRREAVGLEGPDQAVGVAVFVVEERAVDARRQRALDVADLLAHLVPQVGHLGGRGVVAQRDVDHGLAGLGVALDVVEVGQLLQLGLDLLGDLLLDLARGGAGPGRRHHHLLDGEGRILAAAEIEEGVGAGRDQRDHEEHGERAVFQRQRREIGARGHGCLPRRSGVSAPPAAPASPSVRPRACARPRWRSFRRPSRPRRWRRCRRASARS